MSADVTSATLQVNSRPESSRRARTFVADRCSEAGTSSTVTDVVVLLTSEVVSNVVAHARTAATVQLTVDLEVVRLEVCDQSPVRPPEPRDPGPHAEGGRGLFLVDQLSDDWGVDDSAPGKVVWFEVRLARPGGSARP